MFLNAARRLSLLISTLVTFTLVGVVPAAAAGPDWGSPGPYQVAKENLSAHTLYYPQRLGNGGVRHPIIIWGNGTAATPTIYDSLLRHWASHGFIVAAANTTQAGSGREMRAGIDLLAARNGDSRSPFYQKVDLGHIGAAGHSQGGAGTLNAAADPRVTTAAPIQPGGRTVDFSKLHGPTLFLSGQRDTIVSPASVKGQYNNANHVPAIYAELRGASHFTPLGDGGGYRGPTTAWMRALLMNDQQARAEYFGKNCGYCTSQIFSEFLRNSHT